MKPQIFVSSTFYDQKSIRSEIANFIIEYGFEPILSENGDIGYIPGQYLDDACCLALKKSSMAILVIGGSYGSPATGEDDTDPFNHYISVTRKEFKEAIRSNVTLFAFVDRNVLGEYTLYRNNVALFESSKSLVLAATKNINVFRFIKEIYDLKKIPVFEFNVVEDIKLALRNQWADMLSTALQQNRISLDDFDSNVDEVSIAGEWVSVYIEETNILHESIVVEQRGRNVTAKFKSGAREYLFIGKFKHRILMGEYHSNNKQRDERGNMMLKLVGDSLLSGQITFVYRNEEVSTSAYVWTLKSYQDLSDGTYKFCETCVPNNRKCCCANPDVDMPILLPHEVATIERTQGIKDQDFCTSKTLNISQMNRTQVDHELFGCPFYDGQQCRIYDYRPLDCRLFPFDILLDKGQFLLIYYTEICPGLKLTEERVEYFVHNLKPLLSLMYPYLSESTFAEFNQKLRGHKYRVVGPLQKYM